MSWTIAAACMLVAGVARSFAQDVPALPTPTEVAGTDYCIILGGWEYSPRWNIPDNVVNTMTIEECAEVCAANEICTGATWLNYPDNADKKNCWMKSWPSPPAPAGTPCYGGDKPNFVLNAVILKNGPTCADITFVAPPVDCETELATYEDGESAVLTPKTVGVVAAGPTAEPVAAPAAATPAAAVTPDSAIPAVMLDSVTMLTTAAGSYVAYKGYDYIPSDVTPTAVEVVDVGTGSVAADEVACATACDDAPGCNTASYYGLMPEAEWPAKKNCWLKTLAVGCVPPADASTENPLAELLMKVTGQPCSAAFSQQVPTAMPIGVPEILPPVSLAPGEVPLLPTSPLSDDAVTIDGPPTAEEVTTRDFENESVVADPPSAGAYSNAFGAVVATVAAAAALLV